MRYPFLSSTPEQISPSAGLVGMARVWLRIRSDRIHFLKFILEGYDGLGLLSTLDSRHGVVTIWSSRSGLNELFGLLADLAPTLRLHELPTRLSTE
jgi:hypothetical protein